MLKKFIADNGGMLVVLAAALAIGAGYLEWRIDVNTRAAVTAAGSVTPEQLAAALKDITTNSDDIDDLEETDKRFDGKIDRIVDILLEE